MIAAGPALTLRPRVPKGWHPDANAPSEAAAVDQPLASCARQDTDCTIHAIGNFRVADKISRRPYGLGRPIAPVA